MLVGCWGSEVPVGRLGAANCRGCWLRRGCVLATMWCGLTRRPTWANWLPARCRMLGRLACRVAAWWEPLSAPDASPAGAAGN